MVALVLALLVIESVFRYFFIYVTNWLGQNVIKDLRMGIFSKIMNFSQSYFDTTPVGTSVSRVINDVETINDIFSEGMISVMADLLTIAAVISIMLYSDWQLTLVTLTVFPFLLLGTYYFKESVKKAYNAERTHIANLYAFLQEHITGMSVIQYFTAEERELAKFKSINKNLRQANIDSVWAYSVFFPVVELISAAAIALVVWWGANSVLHHQSSIGILIAFLMYINLLFRPLKAVADKFNTLQRGMIAGNRVMNVLQLQYEIDDSGTITAFSLQGKIEMQNVSMHYVASQPVLQDISLTIEPGKMLAIVGDTGSGKTTLAALINRSYEFQEGKILIDNVDIRKYAIEPLRQNIGIVQQDVFLFSGTVEENITLYNQSISYDKIVNAAKMLGMHDFIMKLPHQYQQQVLERGSSFSAGQRQLISFIRTLVYNPRILILDEATSSVDTKSELLVKQATEKLLSGRTSIVIAHRLSTIQQADKIIVLRHGRIVEQGTPSELLTTGGLFAELTQKQFNSMS